MNLKLWWLIYSAYTKITNLKMEDFKMGWKTITGAIVMGLGYAAKALASVYPPLDIVGDALIAIGVALGGIGIRSAIAKSSSEK
jgi:orotate phosphoribosyltransferase-like protein